jgi:GNAT superfamily N-acetyltransferase
MDLGTRPLDDGSLADAVGVLNAGFLDYIVKIEFSLPMLLRMIRDDQIDCSLSCIVKDGERDVGVALIARRGWSCRLAAMAVIPEARGHGVRLFRKRVAMEWARGWSLSY